MSEHENVNHNNYDKIEPLSATERVMDHFTSMAKALQERRDMLIEEIKIREEELVDVRRALGKLEVGITHGEVKPNAPALNSARQW